MLGIKGFVSHLKEQIEIPDFNNAKHAHVDPSQITR
jgi:hypothetical protein